MRGGLPPLRRTAVRCAVLAGGAVAAWLLAAGVAAADESASPSAPSSVSTLASAPQAPQPDKGAGAGDRARPRELAPNGIGLPGGGVPALAGGDSMAPPAKVANLNGLAGFAASAELAFPEGLSLPGEMELSGDLALPAELAPQAGLAFPEELALAGELALPGGLGLSGLSGGLPAGGGSSHVTPIVSTSGDRLQPGMVAAHPAVAAGVVPAPRGRANIATGTGTSPAPAATPDHLTSTPSAPAQERPCLPSPALPAPATAGGGGPNAVETAPAAAPFGGSLHVGAPRRGPTAASALTGQPGTTPD